VLDVLRVPGSFRLFATAMLARVPATALGLVFVLRTKELTGSFAAAGTAAGLYALAMALGAPALGRLVDRRGAPRVLAVAALVDAAALTAFALVPGGALLAFACAAVSGAATPPVGPCLRTLWPRLLGDPDLAHAAFSLESAGVEVTYIAGPVLIAGAIGSWSTAASALTSAAMLFGGTLVFVSSPVVRAGRAAGERGGGRSPLRARGVRTLAVVYVLIGLAFGAVEVGVPATADADGSPHAAGLLLGLWGVGSLLGGLAAARASVPRDRARRLCTLLALLAAGHVLLAVPAGLFVFGALLLLAGAAIAPAFAIANGLVDGVAPAGTVTEAFTWLTTGVASGLAAGSALGGTLAQGPGAGAAFALAATALVGAATYAAARRRELAPI
jgi:predicted MFS family arabinose efflux permease